MRKLLIFCIVILTSIIIGCSGNKTTSIADEIYDMYIYSNTEFPNLVSKVKSGDDKSKLAEAVKKIMQENQKNIDKLDTDKLEIKNVKDEDMKTYLNMFSMMVAYDLREKNNELDKIYLYINNGAEKVNNDDIDVLNVEASFFTEGMGKQKEFENMHKEILDLANKNSKKEEKQNDNVSNAITSNSKPKNPNVTYRLFNPGNYLNNDIELPMVMTRQGVSRYVDCRSANIVGGYGNDHIISFDMIVTSDSGVKREKHELMVRTEKGVAVYGKTPDNQWKMLDQTTVSLADYNAGLVLCDYLGL